jgi:curved DNA-binding protein CbpA
MVKSHYELLGVGRSSDLDTIRRAFRREIARYHPDKVMHLGRELQQLASERAAELTVAYTTLTNPEARAAYDASLAGQSSANGRGSAASHPARRDAGERTMADEVTSARPDDGRAARGGPGQHDILQRAALTRMRRALEDAVADADFPAVNGFDLACLSPTKPSLFRRHRPPGILVRIVPLVDRATVVDAWTNAARAGLPHRPLVLVLIGHELAPTAELSQAVEEQRRRQPGMVHVLLPVPVRLRDWNAKVPSNTPAAVRALLDALKDAVSAR